ncbi:MAG: hypothetical protein RL380_553 [Verrucomicrobiota bacterium]|jgi:hypothetical protein
MKPEAEADADEPLDRLWREYARVFADFDDLTLARWLAQTLGQLQGRVWRASHPLLAAYRLGAQAAQAREIWHKRLVNLPAPYVGAPCCRAPQLPLLTRDLRDAGFICQHCHETLVPFDELPETVKPELAAWATAYAPIHAVAHWDDAQIKKSRNYDRDYEAAAQEAERLLARLGGEIAPKLLEHFPAAVWEDHDECLEVRAEDIPL